MIRATKSSLAGRSDELIPESPDLLQFVGPWSSGTIGPEGRAQGAGIAKVIAQAYRQVGDLIRVKGRSVDLFTDILRYVEELLFAIGIPVHEFPIAPADSAGGADARTAGPPLVGIVPDQVAVSCGASLPQ